ncbi:MAG: hypothetical protein ABIQ40_11330 [Bacteroidia bacterium]
MKKLFISLSVFASIFTMAFTGDNDCSYNDFFKEGTKSKMGYYNSDKVLTGTGVTEVGRIYTSGDSTIAVINSVYTDAKKNEPHNSQMKLACVNGAFVMDMSGLMNSMTPQGHDIKMIFTGNMIAYKSSYSVGEKLEDVNMSMEMISGGSSMLTSDIKITDRKVESYDDLVVPAGTFKCYKISYISSGVTKMKSMTMPATQPLKSVMFYCPNVGMIRTESYKDDKIYSYSELLELTKP